MGTVMSQNIEWRPEDRDVLYAMIDTLQILGLADDGAMRDAWRKLRDRVWTGL